MSASRSSSSGWNATTVITFNTLARRIKISTLFKLADFSGQIHAPIFSAHWKSTAPNNNWSFCWCRISNGLAPLVSAGKTIGTNCVLAEIVSTFSPYSVIGAGVHTLFSSNFQLTSIPISPRNVLIATTKRSRRSFGWSDSTR